MLHPNRIPHNPPPLYLNLAYPSSTSFKIPVPYPQFFVRHVGPRGVQERSKGTARWREREIEKVRIDFAYYWICGCHLHGTACLCY